MKRLPSEDRLMDLLIKVGSRLPKEILSLEPRLIVRIVRRRLRMTQKQLAQRVKIPQSYLAKIESGKVMPSLPTLQKIFQAMGCSCVFIIGIQTHPDVLLDHQIKLAAIEKTDYVAGTMALEEQKPTDKELKILTKQEEKRLKKSDTSKIWDVL